MELALLIYSISLLEGLSVVLGLSILALSIYFVVCFIRWGCSRHDRNYSYSFKGNEYHKAFETSMSSSMLRTAIGILVLSFVAAGVPSKQTAWMMVAGYAGQAAVQSETAKKLGGIIDIKLQEVLDEVSLQAKKKAESINK